MPGSVSPFTTNSPDKGTFDRVNLEKVINKIILLLIIFTLISCDQNADKLSEEDKASIEDIRRSYINGWLAGDAETVLNLFESNATIIPSGMLPITGINQIEDYWFPNDSSITTIHSYEVELLELSGSNDIAYSLEKGTLNFSYEKAEFSMTTTSVSHASTVYRKSENGEWKVVSRMWTQLNQ